MRRMVLRTRRGGKKWTAIRICSILMANSGINPDVCFNRELVAKHSVDAAILGTTVHGRHGDTINELHWSSDQSRSQRCSRWMETRNDQKN
ncbi:MAG TPA: hypothetical protein DCS30_06005 [Rhizobiales bacterium]|nr:hypothetical protein [Hyphomicrobiales bacterium]